MAKKFKNLPSSDVTFVSFVLNSNYVYLLNSVLQSYKWIWVI